ncbi:hypothetical protein Tco_0950927 [Tanacetum coccineum]|uniref:Uncharacterized protein n=1 Tax=Tanacetum coccineum TaxID=301880 RepID=A0ABQ5DV51_9ASTR
MSKVLQERGFGSLPSSTETNPRDHVKSISTTVEADASSIRHIGSNQYARSTRQNSTLMYETRQTTILFPSSLNDCYCKEKKGSYGLPFLSTAHAKIDVFKRKITLRVGEEKIIFKSVKPASSLIKRIYMLSLRERMELDLEARLGRDFVLNNSLDPFIWNYIEQNDLILPIELRRDQVDDLIHHSEGEVDFAVLEDMDAYRDEGMGDVIFGEPFLREVGDNQGPYANAKTKKDYDPNLDNNANNAGDTQDTKKEHHDPSIFNIRKFKMVKHSFSDDEEYDLAAKKSTMLVKYLQSGNLEVLES